MITFEKFSDVSKEVSKNKKLRNFDSKILRYQVQIANKQKLRNSRIKANLTMLKSLGKTLEDMKTLKIKPAGDFSRAYKHFMENIHGVDGKLLAKLDQDRLERDLSLCENDTQKEIVTTYWEEKSKVVLQDVDMLLDFYTKVGLHKPESEDETETVKEEEKPKANKKREKVNS